MDSGIYNVILEYINIVFFVFTVVLFILFTAMAYFGLLTRFNLLKFYHSRSKNFSVGAAIKNLGFNALEEPLPTLASAGFAYSPFRPLLIAAGSEAGW